LETTSFTIILIFAVLAAAGIIYVLFSKNKQQSSSKPANNEAVQLQLQAYERLILLIDRIALPNLISRVGKSQGNAKEMQLFLVQNIKKEFEYNITQQIYVSPDAWTAVKNLKEQNILIINQFASVLPPQATSLDLNKLLLEYLMNDKKGSLHEVVSEVLSYEAKKLLGNTANER
jgi:hypothetical protein